MAPAEGGGRGKRPKKRTSSIRAAAEHAAGSASSSPPEPPSESAGPPGESGQPAATSPLRKPTRRRSRTSEATRRAAAEASQPPGRRAAPGKTPGPLPPEGKPAAGESAFPDYEVKSESWDPWDANLEPPGRPDPDFDAQRTLGEWLEGVIPVDAQVHFANAGREFAQGVQVTVDHHTGKRRSGESGEGPGGPSRIEID